MAHTQSETPPRLTGRLVLAVVAGTFLLALPRFAHTTPDSVYYTDLAAYFAGNLSRDVLQTPFAFRWVVPWLATLLAPVDAGTAIACLSMVATAVAYLVLLHLWAGLFTRQSQFVGAAGMLVVSFPTVNYASAVLTDAAGFLVLALACHAMVRGHTFWLALVLAVGTGVRESTLIMVPALWIYLYLQPRPGWVASALCVTATTILAALASRWYFADLPAYFWVPTWSRSIANMTRPVSWATAGLTVAPLLALLAIMPRRTPAMDGPLRAMAIALAAPGLALVAYSVVAAFMSGRFCWPLYLALIPVLAWRLGGETSKEG